MEQIRHLNIIFPFSEYEKRVRDLESQLKLKIQIIEELNQKAEKTSPELVKLHEELIEMKRCHSLDLERAEQKAVEAEERSSHLRIQQAQCLKIIQNVSFNIASEASDVYILSAPKFIKNAKNGPFSRSNSVTRQVTFWHFSTILTQSN